MATVSEAIGLALPYSAGAPAPYEIRDAFCMTAGEQVMDLIKRRHPPARHRHPQGAGKRRRGGRRPPAARPMLRCICRRSRTNAASKFDLFDVAEVFKRTPYIADLKPGGRYVAKDMFEAGGVPLLMKTLLDHGYLHGDCMTVTGRTIAENLKRVKWNKDQDVVRPADKPLSATGGVVGLKGNLAPEGAIVKVAGMADLKFTGPARCFDGEEACFEAVKNKQVQGRRRARDPLRGPQGRPRHARDAGDHRRALRPGHGRQGRAHHRRALLRRDARLLHRPCRPGGRGRRPDRAVRDGDIITIDAEKGTLDVKLSQGRARQARAKTWKPRKPQTSPPAICGNTPSRWDRRATAR